MNTRRLAIGVVAICGAFAISVSSWAQSAKPSACLCNAQEKRFFSCRTARGKSIALCGTPEGVVQYRFGTRQKIELTFPTQADQTLRYASYMRFQTENYEISFDVSGTKYSVFEYSEEGEHSAGVRVVTSDHKERVIRCAGNVFGRLADLEKRLPCDEDNALNMGGCPKSAK